MSKWTNIDSIFDQALDKPVGERENFIRVACGDDLEMLAEVEALLKAIDKSDSKLDAVAAELAVPLIGESLEGENDNLAGQIVDSKYELIESLGRGGMGVVYLARQIDGQVERDVALKLIKKGMDTDLVLTRFRRERNVLASLQHPNIASLLDAGTTQDGLPYFAMEYVDGIPIDKYCSEQSLSVSKRLELFLHVCEAVQHAHANLVIHRDLKPSNILVDKERNVKLLDFGIAKLVDGEDGSDPQTLTSQRALTPAYASPEQFSNSRISTSSDVYSLGIVLYELLSGERPFDFKEKSTGQIEDLVFNKRPRRPSAALTQSRSNSTSSPTVKDPNFRIKGDLDVICLHALEKEASKRYNSVNEFSSDIKRFLRGRTIGARPASIAYRLKTFSKRNRLAIASGVTAVALLIAGSVFSLRQASFADQAAEVARAEAEKANRTVEFVVDILKEVGPKEREGEPITGHAIIQAGVEKVSELSHIPLVKAKMLATMGEISYHLGDHTSADSLLKESLILRKRVESPSPIEISESLYQLGKNRRSLKRDFDGALSFFLEADSLLGILAPNSVQSMNVGFETARTYYMLDKHELALNMLEDLINKTDSLGLPKSEALGTAYSTIGSILVRSSRHEEALHAYEQAYEILSELEGENDPATLSPLMGIGRAQFSSGMYSKAKTTFQRLVAKQIRVLGPNHTQLGTGYLWLGKANRGLKEYDLAIENEMKAYEIYMVSYGAEHFYTAFPFREIGQVYAQQKKWSNAEDNFSKAMGIVNRATGVRELHPFVLRLEILLANSLVEQRKFAEAEKVLEKSYGAFLETEEDLDPIFDELYSNFTAVLRGIYQSTSRLEKASNIPVSFRK